VFSESDVHAYLRDATESFELEGKRSFNGKEDHDITIKVGGRITNESIGLRHGFLTVTNGTVNSFFAPWVDDIVRSIEAQLEGQKAEQLLIVGGFGDSPYLRERLKVGFPALKTALTNDQSSEVVSDGAVIWLMTNSVTARASRFTYGVAKQCVYQSSNEAHKGRPVIKRKGGNIIEGVWDPVMNKDDVRDQGFEVTLPLWTSFASRNIDLSHIQMALYAPISNDGQNPYFVLDEAGDLSNDYTQVCVIKADMAGMQNAMKAKWSLTGRSWRLPFHVAVKFGGTELKAQIVWKDKEGKENRGPASIVAVRR
jgi:hypothetical protein